MKSDGTRVLMLLENNPFPQDRRVKQEADALVAGGYTVRVISPRGAGQPFRERVDGVEVYRYPPPREGNGLFAYLWEYGYSMVIAFLLSWLLFFRHGFDVIHAHNPPDTFVLVAAPFKLLGRRFVFDHHDLSPEMYFARFGGSGNRVVHRLLLLLEALSLRMADHVIATNESYRALQMTRGRVPAERITVVRNGPDPERIRDVAPDPALRRRGETILGYVGVMGYQDGLDYLLRSLHYLRYELGRRDFFCILIGDGEARESLRELAARLNIEEHLLFTGRVSDADTLCRYLCSTDICLDPDPSNPYNDRSTMIKMMEYMALGKPVVAFDLPEHRVTAKDAALYAQPNEEAAFARAIEQLMDDPELRRQMGEAGRARVEQCLAWSHQARHLLSAYASLTGRAEPRSAQARERETT